MKVPVAAPGTLDVEQPAPAPRGGVWAPFRYRDFRLLWCGLLVSNLGTWMQLTALGYEVVRLAGSARAASLDVGLLGASSAIPVVLLSPLAGVVADRYPRRRVLVITNIAQIAVALALAIVASLHLIALWELFVAAGLRSATQAFDAPARQSWVPLLVAREDVGSAIGLNSVAFNAPSVVGPPLAGVSILSVGVAASFSINVVATCAVLVALAFMKPAAPSETSRQGMWPAMLAGIRFMAGHPVLRSVLLVLVAVCALVRPYAQLMPAYAAHVVHVDARGLGLLLAASGVGAIAGSLLTALVGSRRRGPVWFASALAMGVGAVVLGTVHVFAVALVVLVGLGLATLSFAGNSNVLIQTLAPDEMRGRAIAVFSMIVLGLVPAGALVLGALATLLGLSTSMAAGGALALGLTLVVWTSNADLRAA